MLDEEIERARKALRDLKRSPLKWMLPEYQELQAARGDLETAKARLLRAERAWDQLGEQK